MRVSRSTGVNGRSTITCSLAVVDSTRRRGSTTGARSGERGAPTGGCTRTRPTAPLVASTYHGPVAPTITPERGGKAAADVEENARVSPRMRRRLPACHRACPLCTSAHSTSSTRACVTQVRASLLLPNRRASSRTAGLAPSSAAIRRGVVEAAVPVRSPTRSVDTTQAYGTSPGASSNTVRCRSCSGAAASRSRNVCCSGLRSEGKRSNAASAAAARCAQPGIRQVQWWSNTTRRPSSDGVIRTFCSTPLSCTMAVIVSPSSCTSTRPASPRLRPRVIVRASKMRPRSWDENGSVIGVR